MLLLVLATGAMDAACLLHLGVFTAYITASLILAGANLVDSPGSPWPGLVAVAGFIVGIGITADSFVIYFERIKDEVREGRTFRSAVPRGWQRAKRTILSADAVSFLSAFILYVLAVGEVRGFAFTLGLSTVLDLVVVFLVTHPLVHLAAGSPLFSSPTWSGLGSVAKAGARQRSANAKLAAKEVSV